MPADTADYRGSGNNIPYFCHFCRAD